MCDYNNDATINTQYVEQLCETDKLILTAKYPDIAKIVKTSASITIASFSTIKNPLENKIVVNAVKHIKIVYSSNASCNQLYCAKFSVPFSIYIPIGNCNSIIDKIHFSVENICAHQISNKLISASMIISAWPVFKTEVPKKKCPSPPPPHNENNICKIKKVLSVIFEKILSIIVLVLQFIKMLISRFSQKPHKCKPRHCH